ncbi:hypothetical protein OUHCRE15_19480 [Enterobacter hormaechei subsp. xiangfangensis]
MNFYLRLNLNLVLGIIAVYKYIILGVLFYRNKDILGSLNGTFESLNAL